MQFCFGIDEKMKMFQTLKIDTKPNEKVVNLLTNNRIGTPGKSMVYEHRNVLKKLEELTQPYFVNLAVRNILFGTVCFSKRNFLIQGESKLVYYIRYFSFKENYRSNGNPGNIKKRRNSLIKDEISRLLDGEGLEKDVPILFYAYVDSENIRSSRLIHEFGFSKVGILSTIVYSRVFPKDNKNIAKAEKGEFSSIIEALNDYYKGFQFAAFENLFKNNDYYLIKVNDQIVAGAQANPEEWFIVDIPGIKGWILKNIVPGIPFVNRLFKHKFKFISINAIYCKEGYEKELQTLFSCLLYKYRVHTAIMAMDKKSILYRQVTCMDLGIVNAIQGEAQSNIVVKSTDNSYEREHLPFYISAFDIM